MIRTYIVAGVGPYREALGLALEATGRVEVVGAASHPADVVCEFGRLQPQVVLFEVSGPHALGWAHEITSAAPSLRLIALGLDESKQDLGDWVDAGVAGFVGPEAHFRELLSAIEIAAREGAPFRPANGTILRLAPEAPGADATIPRGIDRYLTVREREIVRLLGQGMSNRGIAATLFIAQPTVKNHMHNIMSKLGVSRRAEVLQEVRRGTILLMRPRRGPGRGRPSGRVAAPAVRAGTTFTVQEDGSIGPFQPHE
jgi:two-component system, NarL family, nitrate/nitrite response regulator NarL